MNKNLHVPTIRPPEIMSDVRVEELKKLFPEVVADNQINSESLKEALSTHVDDADGKGEHYGLTWPGKRDAKRVAMTPPEGALVAALDEGIDEEHANTIFIEGENLQVLKLLQKSYAEKIKMIYIDPPYNTGNDLIYEDNFREPLEEYLRRTGQVDDKGRILETVVNKKSDGRFHSKWLTMMYPRLKLAKNLLTDDGILFVSIDDNEVHNLRMILDELFGAENLLEMFVWESIFRPSNMSQKIRKNCEYILAYVKNISEAHIELIERREDPQGEASLTQNNNKPRQLKFPGGIVHTKLKDGVYSLGVYDDVQLHDSLVVKHGKVVDDFRLSGKFKWSQEYLNKEIVAGVELTIKTETFIPYYKKVYQQTALRPTKILPTDLVGDVLEANAELAQLFGRKLFNYPKPTSLIRFLCRTVGTQGSDIILDFFAGSGTTAHAVMQLNTEDDGHRRSISVQLPEILDPNNNEDKVAYEFLTSIDKPTTIAEIAKERIRRAIKKIKKENSASKAMVGFKVYTYTKSNFNKITLKPSKELMLAFDSDPLIEKWKPENIMTEVMLLEGFPFDSTIITLNKIKTNHVSTISSEDIEGRLYICLDDSIKAETIRSLDLVDTDRFICLDSAITDQDKLRLSDKGLIKTI